MQLQLLCIKTSSKLITNQQSSMFHLKIDRKETLGSLPKFLENVKFYTLLWRNSEKNSNPSNIQLEEIAKNELDESHLIKEGRCKRK